MLPINQQTSVRPQRPDHGQYGASMGRPHGYTPSETSFNQGMLSPRPGGSEDYAFHFAYPQAAARDGRYPSEPINIPRPTNFGSLHQEPMRMAYGFDGLKRVAQEEIWRPTSKQIKLEPDIRCLCGEGNFGPCA